MTASNGAGAALGGLDQIQEQVQFEEEEGNADSQLSHYKRDNLQNQNSSQALIPNASTTNDDHKPKKVQSMNISPLGNQPYSTKNKKKKINLSNDQNLEMAGQKDSQEQRKQ